jgi:hypothetical protein
LLAGETVQRLELAAQHHAAEFGLGAMVEGIGEAAPMRELGCPLAGGLTAEIAGRVA